MASKRSPPKQTTEQRTQQESDKDAASTLPSKNGPQSPSMKGVTSMKVDLSGISLTPAPRGKGEYPGRLINHELRLASGSSGQPVLNLHFEDLSSPGKVIYTNYSMQPQSLWKWKRDMIRMGASVEQMNDKSVDVEEIIRSLYGFEAVLEFGEPRQDPNDPERVYASFLGVKDPTKP